MKVGKPQSKRVPVRLRHKIQKASNAKQRKDRKEAKKNPQWKSRVKKDPGIPNLFPYKAKVLAEIEEQKRRKEQESVKRREIARAQREGRAAGEVDGVVFGEEVLMDDEEVDSGDEAEAEGMEVEGEGESGSANPMAALLASARARADAYAPAEEDDEDSEEDEGDDEGEEWTGITEPSSTSNSKSTKPATKPAGLPKAAIADPIKTCTKLLQQMQQTTDGIQRLISTLR